MKLHTITKRSYRTSALLLAVLLIFAGCKKGFLDRDPQGQYTQDDYPYPMGSGPYDTYLFGAYSELRAFNVHSQSFIAATSIRSDDADKGSTPADGGANAIDMDNFPVSPSNGFANTLWLGYYSLANKCNIALDQVKNNGNIVATPEVKLQSEGEARFLRAYSYFMLVRLFGRVPIIDQVFTDPAAQANVPQSEPAAVYTFIEDDLQFAAANLPTVWDDKFVGRATSGAANGLLAKVYLTQQKWQQAMATASLVMGSGLYNLSMSYDNVFREVGENGPESVFEVQATATFQVKTANGVQYASIQGVRGTGIWNLGWGWNTPSTSLEDAYEDNDPRRTRTILYTSNGTTTYSSIYGEELPVGLPNPRYNHKIHSDPGIRNAIASNGSYWMNIRILRYADVVLMYAEAANEAGGAANIEAARVALNSVRERARRGAPAGTLPDITTTDQAELRDSIRHERRVEMGMEHDRFFDIVRWGIAQEALHAAGKTNFSNSRDVLLPIPQVQIDLSQGKLTQNAGY
ncbi:MAG TPA: RagB/SusD family nutrient uptake outer membrane protein [Chitinophagaceae bacterium]|nr:RagB/SusD family nutrient uptake outer membrane protein [Chitinophagaceae bacterium]